MKRDTPATDGRTLRSWALFGIALSVLAILFLAPGVLYWKGRPADWTRIAWNPSSSVEGFTIDRAIIGPQGAWLLWFDSSLEAVCVKNLEGGEAVAAYHPGECFAVVPIAVIEENLLALRSRRVSGFLENLKRGFAKFISLKGSTEDFPEEAPAPEDRVSSLEAIDLGTGKTVARNAAFTTTGALVEPSDFELGNVSFSPAADRFAYWAAQERAGATPLQATVTEVLRVFDSVSNLNPVVDRTVSSSGTYFPRSSLLSSIGRPLWFGRDTCVFVSFLDSGSLIPVDVPRSDFDAVYSIAELYRKISEENPNLQYGPERIEPLNAAEDADAAVLFWGRQQDSVHFFLFDSQLRFLRETVVETTGYDIETTVWLGRSERLLVDDKSRNRLVGLSPFGNSTLTYPFPPDWRDGFQILGEDFNGALVGTNRRMFLRTSPDRRDWETVPLF